MGDWWKQWLTEFGWTQSLLLRSLDLGLVLAITYMVLVIMGSAGHCGWSGVYCLDGISDEYQPETDAVEFVLEKLVIGSAVAMAVVFVRVSPVSRTIGRGEFRPSLRPSPSP